MDRLTHKVILVTGAAQGIGAAIARCAAHEGAIVIVSDRDGRGAAVADELARAGGEAVFEPLDVRDASAWERVVENILSHYGRLDGLVNNAGVNVKHEPLAMPDTEWDRCFDINLRALWQGCKAVLPTMIAQGRGSIVNISSVHGQQIIPGSFPYNVAKHGVVGLTRALGVEYAARGIRVNAISPGYVDTPLCREWWDQQPDPAQARRDSAALIPSGCIVVAEEVGATAVFLLSDEAPSIVAANIDIDGGRLALYHE